MKYLSLLKIRCNKLAKKSIHTLAIAAFTMISIVPSAQAADCNGNINLAIVGDNYAIVGSEYTVTATLFTGTITGGTENELTANRFKYYLDCDADLTIGIPCTDEGDMVRYISDTTIVVGDGCVDTNGVKVDFTTNGVDSVAGPNEVIFTPSAPVVMAANTSPANGCVVQFDVRVETVPSTDISPTQIESIIGYRTATNDATCDFLNGVSGANQSGNITLCAACAPAGECNFLSCNPDTGQCDVDNPINEGDICTEFPNSDACQDDLCVEGLCVENAGDPPNCDDGNACNVDSCDTVSGDCVHDQPTDCDDGNACNVDSCDTVTGDCVHDQPTDCDDGNACNVDSCDTEHRRLHT